MLFAHLVTVVLPEKFCSRVCVCVCSMRTRTYARTHACTCTRTHPHTSRYASESLMHTVKMTEMIMHDAHSLRCNDVKLLLLMLRISRMRTRP